MQPAALSKDRGLFKQMSKHPRLIYLKQIMHFHLFGPYIYGQERSELLVRIRGQKTKEASKTATVLLRGHAGLFAS